MKKHLLALALIPVAFSSCTDDSYDLDNMSNEVRIGLNEYLPIASSSVKLKDILSEFKSDYINSDEDGVLKFCFDTVTHVEIKPLDIVFDEATFDLDFYDVASSEIKGKTIPAKAPFNVPINIDLSFDGGDGSGKVSMLHVKNGTVTFHFIGDAFDAGKIAIVSSSIGESFTKDGEDYIKINLDDELLQFVDGKLNVSLSLQAKETIDLSDNSKFQVVLDKSDLTYHEIRGSFKSSVEQLEKTKFDVNLYSDNLDYHINVLNPTLRIIGSTNSGIPLDCSIKSLVGKHNTEKSTKKDSIKATFLGGIGNGNDPYSFKFDKMKYSLQEGHPVESFDVTFNKINGSLDKIFGYMPDTVDVTCGIRIDGDEDVDSYFLLDSTYMDLQIVAEVPLWLGDSSYCTITDTIDGIDIVKEITDYQEGNFHFDAAEVVIEFENELPLEAVVTAKFCKADTSSSGKVTLYPLEDSKLHQTVKVPAATCTNGFVTSAKPSTTKINLTDDMVDDLKEINSVYFTYKIKVPKGSVDGIFLTNDCGLSAKVYGHVKANISNKEK